RQPSTGAAPPAQHRRASTAGPARPTATPGCPLPGSARGPQPVRNGGPDLTQRAGLDQLHVAARKAHLADVSSNVGPPALNGRASRRLALCRDDEQSVGVQPARFMVTLDRDIFLIGLREEPELVFRD